MTTVYTLGFENATNNFSSPDNSNSHNWSFEPTTLPNNPSNAREGNRYAEIFHASPGTFTRTFTYNPTLPDLSFTVESGDNIISLFQSNGDNYNADYTVELLDKDNNKIGGNDTATGNMAPNGWTDITGLSGTAKKIRTTLPRAHIINVFRFESDTTWRIDNINYRLETPAAGGDPHIYALSKEEYKLEHNAFYKLYDNRDLNNRFVLNMSCEKFIPQGCSRELMFFKYAYFHYMGKELVLDMVSRKFIKIDEEEDYDDRVMNLALTESEKQDDFEGVVIRRNDKGFGKITLEFALNGKGVVAECFSRKRDIKLQGVKKTGDGCLISKDKMEIVGEFRFVEDLSE